MEFQRKRRASNKCLINFWVRITRMFSYLLDYYPSGLISISSLVGILFAICFGWIFLLFDKFKSDKKTDNSKTSTK